jgi:ferrous iron transport protein A
MSGSKPQTLDQVATAMAFTVEAVVHPDGEPLRAQRLEEIGFLPGEAVMVLRRGPLGEPLAVRIGHSTFALRKAEAACVHVRPRPAAKLRP